MKTETCILSRETRSQAKLEGIRTHCIHILKINARHMHADTKIKFHCSVPDYEVV